MNEIFWLVKDKLAGRCGPDRAPWNLHELRAGGIHAVLSVNAGIGCNPAEFESAAISYACIAMPANEPPQPGDDDLCYTALPQTYRFISEHIRQGRAVLVHCTAGKDRTGMAMAYYLMRERGLSPNAALARVREVRPIALSALGWQDMGQRVLMRLYQD